MADKQEKRGEYRRRLVGTVKSDKADKTVMVEVARRYLHPKYKKYMRIRRRYAAHDDKNEYRIGDKVEIREHRPISRTKRWIVTRLIARAVDVEVVALEV